MSISSITVDFGLAGYACVRMFVHTLSQSKMWQNVSFGEGYFSLTPLAERNEALECTALNSFTEGKIPI